MNLINQLTQTLRESLKTETRAEYEERFLAQAANHADFEHRVRHLLEQRSTRSSIARLTFATAGR